jgi:hypothetical protein
VRRGGVPSAYQLDMGASLRAAEVTTATDSIAYLNPPSKARRRLTADVTRGTYTSRHPVAGWTEPTQLRPSH